MVEGKFIRELKNRFLCEVKIDGKVEECYVPSSCHLSNFLQLKGKRVLLIPTQGKNPRTRYALYAAPYRRNYIILNTSLSNVAIEKNIYNRRFSYLGKRSNVQKEHSVDGYKADIYIPNTKTIVEIKSVLSTKDEAIFPTVYSERTQNQLKEFRRCLIRAIMWPLSSYH
jgi:DNA-binding sugar fermentation-stimulating protein